ncbi:type II toxin-antitoxin system RelE family toxin [Actinomadura opuntiae]|uniref:type II toxin-antitoxin system RelE family toxin n=1 Tax=Actinomadura sp. OS1-43 TaxID=604315 RepID=UPI00255B2072|nr:type II toxin-antitoxin system RelE/ParE family toxin [Actinomadura sp. OS1-43]MDL4814560.1 type II toxin-antitoxin system RelE/ParE family toxin [Actinomadura sp. OS1-43]
MKIEWTPEAQQSMRRYMLDQQGMRAIAMAVQNLADDPTPAQAFPWGKAGDYRLRVGPYRLMYRLQADQIIIGHVSRITA